MWKESDKNIVIGKLEMSLLIVQMRQIFNNYFILYKILLFKKLFCIYYSILKIEHLLPILELVENLYLQEVV